MVEPVATSNSPYAADVEAGEEYYWCTCGRSAQPPWCDGAHKGTPYEPVVFVAEKTETVYLCGCAKSGNKPFCDGTHEKP